MITVLLVLDECQISSSEYFHCYPPSCIPVLDECQISSSEYSFKMPSTCELVLDECQISSSEYNKDLVAFVVKVSLG